MRTGSCERTRGEAARERKSRRTHEHTHAHTHTSAEHVDAAPVIPRHGHVPNNSLGTRKQLLRKSYYRVTLRVHISRVRLPGRAECLSVVSQLYSPRRSNASRHFSRPVEGSCESRSSLGETSKNSAAIACCAARLISRKLKRKVKADN